MLLCPNCHILIDNLEPQMYTVKRLEAIKAQHESTGARKQQWTSDARLTEVGLLIIQELATSGVFPPDSGDAALRVLAGNRAAPFGAEPVSKDTAPPEPPATESAQEAHANSSADPRLDAFEHAWRSLHAIVERGSTPREELVEAIDQAVTNRVRARESLADEHGGSWVGDQVLFAREVEVGALARELDGFIDRWLSGGRDLPVDEILEQLRPLFVEPGNAEAHAP